MIAVPLVTKSLVFRDKTPSPEIVEVVRPRFRRIRIDLLCMDSAGKLAGYVPGQKMVPGTVHPREGGSPVRKRFSD